MNTFREHTVTGQIAFVGMMQRGIHFFFVVIKVGIDRVTAAIIMNEASGYFGISIDELIGSSRSRTLVTARQIAMYLCRELTDLSLPAIGQSFGGRDHTTVMHADRKIRQLMAERRSIYNQVTELTNRIKVAAKN